MKYLFALCDKEKQFVYLQKFQSLKQFIRFLFFLTVVVLLAECAKKGRPSGGEKDEDAPIFVVSNPPYETIEFNEDEIVIEFDEFVKLKDLKVTMVQQ